MGISQPIFRLKLGYKKIPVAVFRFRHDNGDFFGLFIQIFIQEFNPFIGFFLRIKDKSLLFA